MKLFVIAVIFAACAAAQAASFDKSPFVTLKDYFETLGDDESRIINGFRATRGQFPWQVSLLIDLGGGRGALCGGSLISSRWVLTAAHCAQGGLSWTVRLGSIDRTSQNEPGSLVLKTSTAIVHEKYNAYLNNDIALIKLNQDVPFTNYIKPIRLPARSEVGNPLTGIAVTVSGWGKTSDTSQASQFLNYIGLTTITNQRCADVYGSLAIISSTICAVGHPRESTCSGDSGGPLIRKAADGVPTQIGVVSFVHKAGCASGNPSGYVRTASFLDWINKHTGIPVRP